MAKKIIRKKSSSRRITVRPLSFWHFIRKNFLIIAGLLLLPVTVGAVLSSYGTFSGSSSAATLNTQDMNLRTLGNTCTDRGLTDHSPVRVLVDGEVNCKGGVLWYEKTCSVCQSGNMELCTQPDQFAVCDMTPPPARDSCSSPSTPNQGYVCLKTLKSCHFCNNGEWSECNDREKQEQCNINIPTSVPDPTVANPTRISPAQTSPTDEPSKPTSAETECNLYGKYDVGGCGENNCPAGSKFKCTYYTADKQTGECGGKECSCEADSSCQGNDTPQNNGQPQTGEGGNPGCLKCYGGVCNDDWSYGLDECAPQETCDQRRREACEKHGGFKRDIKAEGIGGSFSQALQQAAKNFFGIFGF